MRNGGGRVSNFLIYRNVLLSNTRGPLGSRQTLPDRLVSHILAAIEVGARATRSRQEEQKLAQIRVKQEDLRYAEEQLVEAEGAKRAPDARPWAVLQVRTTKHA